MGEILFNFIKSRKFAHTVSAQLAETAQIIRNSEFFSEETYEGAEEARNMGLDSVLHYVLHGEAQGLKPSDKFDPVYYGVRYPDVVESKNNRLRHYIEHGRSEGRRGCQTSIIKFADLETLHTAEIIRNSGFFSEEKYLGLMAARAMGMDAALHYVLYGEAQGLKPSEKFDPKYYEENYPDIAAWKGNRLRHFIERGLAEERQGHPIIGESVAKNIAVSELADPQVQHTAWIIRSSEFFSEGDYEGAAAARAMGIDAALHYVLYGEAQGLKPSNKFDPVFYEKRYSDIAAWSGNRLRHFIESGQSEGRQGYSTPDVTAISQQEDFSELVDPHALHVAQIIRESDFFSEENYEGLAIARSMGMDAVLHYVLYGEDLGFSPSEKFDPIYYGERYPDIVAWGGNRLWHYIQSGRSEQRQGLPATNGELLPLDTLKANKSTVLILVHEATRTGAPILAWNIARALRSRANVVIVLMRDGAMVDVFEKSADVVVGPAKADLFNHVDGHRFGRRLAETYKPLYVIANSVETRFLVSGFSDLNVPVIALVHEFSGYTKPIGSLQGLYEQAAAIVFPADVVRKSSEMDYPLLKLRKSYIYPQGSSEVPKSDSSAKKSNQSKHKLRRPAKEVLRPIGAETSLLVVGMGFVDWRKGVDLFVSTLTSLLSQNPRANVRFIWVGHGFKVSNAIDISSYLSEQVLRSGIQNKFEFLDAVENVEDIYAEADVLFLSSRLDPLPNVSIDAALRGIPVVCFANASGMAEILMEDVEASELVVSHLDTGAAAILIGKLAEDRRRLKRLGDVVKDLAVKRFNMKNYVDSLHLLGCSAGDAMNQERSDVKTILEHDVFDTPIYLGANAQSVGLPAAIRQYVTQSSKIDFSRIPISGAYTRRPVAGFHPYTYALANLAGRHGISGDPFAHYLRSGKPPGPWAHPVIRVTDQTTDPQVLTDLKIALHAHFHYTDHVDSLARILAVNSQSYRLILTTDSKEKAEEISSVIKKHGLSGELIILPNKGRDIGPFLHVLKKFENEVDVLGHVHGKRSLSTDNVGADFGDRWRTFLWEHLIGDTFPMMDLITQAFNENLKLGLVFPEDPHLIGWEKNFEIAKSLAKRMGLKAPLPNTIDFPVGTMFWARTKALKPLLELELAADEYPVEPVPVDGTILHALERLLPYIAESEGFYFSTTYLQTQTR